jgi:hypothetical protein
MYICTLSLTLSLAGVGGQRHAPAALPSERPGTHCIGGWVGTKAGLDCCGKTHPHRDSIPYRPARSFIRALYIGIIFPFPCFSKWTSRRCFPHQNPVRIPDILPPRYILRP